MLEMSQRLWEAYHANNSSRTELSNPIREAWEKSDLAKVDYLTGKPAPVSDKNFEIYKKDSRFLYISANNILEKMAEQLPNQRIGYALFSSDSCLLKLYGGAAFLEWCQEHYISSKTLWEEHLIGANAVFIGKYLKQPFSSVGAENYCQFLSKIAIHFCPITLDNSIEANSHYGGIAILCPEENNNPYLPVLCSAMMREIRLMSFWHKSTNISKFTSSNASFTFHDIHSQNSHFYDVIQYAKAAASSEASLLILGESGSGKDIIAQAIHNESLRKGEPFVALNCASFSKELISSELFGYEEGSFTGAKKGGTIGKFELANNGTLFLDEIGDMPLDLQSTLLRVLETQSFMKLGGNELIHVNIRIIAATNQNLHDKIQQKLFREDLFYRLGVIRINVPPLRDHIEDIVPLSEFFIDMICNRLGKKHFILDDKVKKFLKSYSWPGNVRELKNMLEGIISIYDGPIIEYAQISHYLFSNVNSDAMRMAPRSTPNTFPAPVNVELSKEDIVLALQKHHGNKVETAKALRISRRTLYRRLTEFNIV